MKALRLYDVGDLRLTEDPQPTPGPGEALLRVTSVGICGSDLHWFSDAGIGDARLDHPLILGHEIAGVIAAGPSKGQRVAVDPAINCGTCEFCQQGDPNLCPNQHFAGHGVDDGGLCEYLAWPERCLHALPDGLSDSDGAMLEPLGVAIYAGDLAQIGPGKRVGVFGCGPIGLLVVQLARAAGATLVIATDKLPHRVDAALAMGADVAFLATNDGDERGPVWDATADHGVDVAIEVAGENPAVDTAIDVARPGGTVVLVGIPGDNRTSFTASEARRKGLTLKLTRRMKHTYPRAIQLVERSLIDLDSIVTHQYPLSAYKDAFVAADRREGIKIVVEP